MLSIHQMSVKQIVIASVVAVVALVGAQSVVNKTMTGSFIQFPTAKARAQYKEAKAAAKVTTEEEVVVEAAEEPTRR